MPFLVIWWVCSSLNQTSGFVSLGLLTLSASAVLCLRYRGPEKMKAMVVKPPTTAYCQVESLGWFVTLSASAVLCLRYRGPEQQSYVSALCNH